MATLPVTVVETDEFLRQAKAVFSTAEADALKTFLAYDPMAGVVMRGTGGVRKLRWATRGRGKRGGARHLLLSQRRPARVPGNRVCEE